jgi:FkbM family methyltransferase
MNSTSIRRLAKQLLPASVLLALKDRLPRSLYSNVSYAQQGEDRIVNHMLVWLIGPRPIRYLDIGANHPFRLSNTALFYTKGGDGILVEPDPYLCDQLRRRRPRDLVLQCGVDITGSKSADLYVIDPNTLNTFSKQEAERYVELGHRLVRTERVELITPNDLLARAGRVDLFTLDVEGLDQAILEDIDWSTNRPTCVCVETCSYERTKEPRKMDGIIDFMKTHHYMLYADTFVNSIFVCKTAWQKRFSSTDI